MENKIDDAEINHDDLLFSKDEKKMLAEAGCKPIVLDTECPETTPEKAKKFKRVNPKKRIV